MRIALGKEKALRERVYDFDSMQALVDEILVDEGRLVKDDGGYCYENGSEDGFASFMIPLSLKESRLVLDNVEAWIRHNSDDCPEKCCIEDAKGHYLLERDKDAS